MKKINENQKVTLTLSQLKKLIKESIEIDPEMREDIVCELQSPISLERAIKEVAHMYDISEEDAAEKINIIKSEMDSAVELTKDMKDSIKNDIKLQNMNHAIENIMSDYGVSREKAETLVDKVMTDTVHNDKHRFRKSYESGEGVTCEDSDSRISEIKRIINHYFENDPWTDEPNEFYEPDLAASEVIDQIVEVLY